MHSGSGDVKCIWNPRGWVIATISIMLTLADSVLRALHGLAQLTLTAAPSCLNVTIVLNTEQATGVGSENIRCSWGSQEDGEGAAGFRGHPKRPDAVPSTAVPNSCLNPRALWDPPLDQASGAETLGLPPRLQNALPSLLLSSQNVRGLMEPPAVLPQAAHSFLSSAWCQHLSPRDRGLRGMNAWLWFLPSQLGPPSQARGSEPAALGPSLPWPIPEWSRGLGSSYVKTLGQAGSGCGGC